MGPARGGPVSGEVLLALDGLTAELPVEGRMQTVLHDVSLSIEAGEAVGLVGESGSGKSMTARAIARLLPPGARRGGALRYRGAEVGELRGGALREYRGDVAMIFQDPPRAHQPGALYRRLHGGGTAHQPRRWAQ